MHAMTRNVPPHTPQCSISMWKTRLSRCIQRMGVRRRMFGHRASTSEQGRIKLVGIADDGPPFNRYRGSVA